jgi:hypothetical protein
MRRGIEVRRLFCDPLSQELHFSDHGEYIASESDIEHLYRRPSALGAIVYSTSWRSMTLGDAILQSTRQAWWQKAKAKAKHACWHAIAHIED